MMQITEDTPPDMLAGAMDLTVHLPNGRIVKMSVERSMPMMDLLVHMTTAHHLQHSGHILQALATSPTSGHDDKILPYKPNAPIGILNIQHVRVVPKNRPISASRNSLQGIQPFESTFRLQVHLPRNQLYVIRVSQNVHLGDIMRKVCNEKKLDMLKYEFRHPGNLDEVLDPKLTLSDYQITEVYIVSKGTPGFSQAFSTNDIMALRKEEERKQLQARTGGGVFNLIFKRGKPSTGTGSLSSENRSISPSHSDDSRSITPPAIQQQILSSIIQESTDKPKPPQRKRRMAPKPPQTSDNSLKTGDKTSSRISTISDISETDTVQRKSESGLTICHSRNSSDSSGYHEPSILSDHCNNTSLPRRTKDAIVQEEICEKRKSNGSLSNVSVCSRSTTSAPGRKKKAAPPPPPPLAVVKTDHIKQPSEKASPGVDASATPPVEKPDTNTVIDVSGGRLNLHEEPKSSIISTSISTVQNWTQPNKLNESTSIEVAESPSRSVFVIPQETSPISKLDNSVENYSVNVLPLKAESAVSCGIKQPTDTSCNIPNIPIDHIETDIERHQSIDKIIEDINDINWDYQIPPPPSEFRDTSPIVNHKTNTAQLHIVNTTQTDYCDSGNTKPMLNTLTLENLEKRKSLVYNREISTSLKVAQENGSNDADQNNIGSKRSTMLNELEDVIQNGGRASLTRHTEIPVTDNTLPNFKIATYSEPKSKLQIFEDDTVRAKVQENTTDDVVFKKPYEFSKSKSNSRNNFYVKHHNSNIVRSESFSNNILNWKPTYPIKRSKSQIGLNKLENDQENKTEHSSLTKSSSLFDVSGLQSLEVMRVIQNKLNTSSNTLEQPSSENFKNSNRSEPSTEDVPKSLPPKSTETENASNTKTYHYQGPPAINISTWSERPKTKVSLKEDNDYRISTNSNGSTTIKVNGTQFTTAQEPTIKPRETKLNNSGVTYRKPFAAINKIEKPVRPHSVAFDSDFDISRVPIVRSVELKKSVTHVNADERYLDVYQSADVNSVINRHRSSEIKPVHRVNSFAQNAPTVLGFRGFEIGNDNTARSRKSWNVPSSYSTLPSKINLVEPPVKTSNYVPNSNVPFSQSFLKRIDPNRASNDTMTSINTLPHSTNNRYSTGSQFVIKETSQPPPPPMPYVARTVKKSVSYKGNTSDPRSDLLNSIRNFGGSKGLRHVKV